MIVSEMLSPLSSQGEAFGFKLLETQLEQVGKRQVFCKPLQFVMPHRAITIV